MVKQLALEHAKKQIIKEKERSVLEHTYKSPMRSILTLTGSINHIRGISEEHHQHRAVCGCPRKHFLPFGFRENRERSGEGKGEK